ncbi:hypothetical protein ACFW04_003952 [Cataglyphis niger]
MVRYAALKGLYDLEKTIGSGGFAKVKLAIHVATGEKVAIKIMEKTTLGEDLPRVKLEVEALKTLLHQHICRLYQVIETESHYFMVLEYCSGGELFDHIVEKNRLSEADSRKFFCQIVSAVAYMHSLGYAHRDLKPENVLLDKEENLKLIDFGLCAKPKTGMQAHLYTSCGSPTYAAPELIMGKKYLGSEVDIWSMGVLLYALLCGFLPFDDNNLENLYKKILNGKYEEPYWLSNDSKALIKSMLQIDPVKRITIDELCHHPWVTSNSLKPVVFTHRTRFEKDDEVLSTMSAICGENNTDIWKKLVKSDRTDYRTATYLLLLDRKLRGLSLKIASVTKSHLKQDMGLSNVSATCSGCPKYVLSKLRRALRRKGIMCHQKGFILQGETEESFSKDKKDSSKSISSQNSCSFELEVCLLEIDPNGKRLVGIRRKRLKGDAWVYKRVCEEILALTAEDISTDPEDSFESKCPI